jgi:hypothetical protein
LNKKILATACLLASVSAPANELDNLVNTSGQIADKLDLGIQYVGAATTMTANNSGIAPLGMHYDAYISSEEVSAYNAALQNLGDFAAYTAAEFLNDQGQIELGLMNDAIDDFADATVALISVVQVADMAAEAQQTNDIQKQEDLQDYVSTNDQLLTVSQDDVQAYNDSLEDVASHASNAVAYLAVAGNEGATDFLQQGADNAGVRFTEAKENLSYVASSRAVLLDFKAQNQGYGVWVDGTDAFGINLMLTRADVLLEGSNSDFYLNGPTQNSCFFSGEGCEAAVNPGPRP